MNHFQRISGRATLLFMAAAALIWAQAPSASPPPSVAAPPVVAPPTAQTSNPLLSRAIPDPAAVERGQKLFVTNCGFCHGPTATGGENGPDLIRSVLALHDEGGDQIGPIIHKGSPEKGMPAFPMMSDEQIVDIAAFIRGRQQAAINRRDYEIQNVVTGDAKKGAAYFNGAGQCSTCHSPTGDLKGVAGRYDAAALQTRFLFPGPRRFGEGPPSPPVELTVTPASGSPVAGTLQYLDDFNVALRDASGSYHSWTRNKDLKVEVRDPLAAHEALLQKYTDDDMHNILAYLVTLK